MKAPRPPPQKKFKKPLDNLSKMCYTKYVIKGRKTHQTGKELITMTNTNTNKVTYTAALSYVLTNCELPAEIAAKLENLLEQTAKRNSAENRKPTKAQLANEELKAVALSALTSTPSTVSEIMTRDARLAVLSNQKVSALVNALVDDGKAIKGTDKRKSVFSKAGE